MYNGLRLANETKTKRKHKRKPWKIIKNKKMSLFCGETVNFDGGGGFNDVENDAIFVLKPKTENDFYFNFYLILVFFFHFLIT